MATPKIGTYPCRYGSMIVRPADKYLGRSLVKYLEFSEGEVALFRKFIMRDAIALDIGANIGAHTLAMSQMARVVLAFEPQRPMFQMLCGSMALNDVRNVHAFPMAVGDVEGMTRVPVINLDLDNNNHGSTSLEGRNVHEKTAFESAPIKPIDSLGLPRLDFIKIDVEGMEEQVLRGGMNSIRRHRPTLYLESDDAVKYPALLSYIQWLGYNAYWHTPLLFNPDNFAGDKEDIFPGIHSINLLCLPTEIPFALIEDIGNLEPAVASFHPRAPNPEDNLAPETFTAAEP